MPKYKITGQAKDTGRKRTTTYQAPNRELALILANDTYITIENIIEIPPEPPTERQIEYAKSLRINIPRDATKEDVSNLITIKTDDDKLATEHHKAIAKGFGIESPRYTGKKQLFDNIQIHLIEPHREKDLAAWFTYRVYRELVDGAENANIKTPNDPVIQQIAEQLKSDETALKSMRRYSGRDLIWFGEFTDRTGHTHVGASNRTDAYKKAASMLRSNTNIRPTAKGNSQARQNITSNEASSNTGCLAIILLVVIIPVIGATQIF